jgi:hypothetical protein
MHHPIDAKEKRLDQLRSEGTDASGLARSKEVRQMDKYSEEKSTFRLQNRIYEQVGYLGVHESRDDVFMFV